MIVYLSNPVLPRDREHAKEWLTTSLTDLAASIEVSQDSFREKHKLPRNYPLVSVEFNLERAP